MDHSSQKRTRRDFVKAIGGTLGGVALLGHGRAGGQALGIMPSGYRFYRVLTANQGGNFGQFFPNTLGNLTGAVMMGSPPSGTGTGYVYCHGTVAPQNNPGQPPALFLVTINYDANPPAVTRVIAIATEGGSIYVNGNQRAVGHLGAGASNAFGQYVTTITPLETSPAVTVANSPGVFLYTADNFLGSWSRLISFADPVTDGSFYGGDFGDVAIDDTGNLLLAAATTQAPSTGMSGFSGSQALIATSIGGTSQSRVVLRTGDLLPLAPAAIQSVGLIDLAADHAFAAQVTAQRLDTDARPGTVLIAGNTQRGPAEHRIVAASASVISPQVASLLNISVGETFLGARVDPRQDIGFVTHVSSFEQSIGSNDLQDLGYYSRRSRYRLGRTKPLATDGEVVSYSAPCISDTGLLYGAEALGDGATQLRISDGGNSEILLRSGDRVPGISPNGDLPITEMLFGQHPTQVDSLGRLAFTAEFLLDSDPAKLNDPNNVITALVIGIPV